MVECQESLFEMFIVSEPVVAALESADLIVDSLDGSGGNGFDVPVEESGTVGKQRLAHGVQDTDA